MTKREALLIACALCGLAARATAQPASGPDLSHAKLTFSAGFDRPPTLRRDKPPATPRPLDDPGFSWLAGGLDPQPMLRDGKPLGPATGWTTLSSNHEAEAYPSGNAIAQGAPDPFSIVDHHLVITARPFTPAEQAMVPAAMHTPYLSGALSTYPYSQTYGYFEMRAKLPAGRGVWPAFWLMPERGGWPPEIDAMEMLGDHPNTIYTSIHTRDPAMKRADIQKNGVSDSVAAFHDYGVDWTPDTLSFYIDRHRVMQRPTPSDMHQPFYMIVNLAIGGAGSWPGAPDANTRFPAQMTIASIRAWARPAP